jgi:hypothetical protein
MRKAVFSTSLASLLCWVSASSAQVEPVPAADPTQASARFALIIGVNKSVDSDVPPLRYADDDAARYLDLFRSLGARSYLLARLDDNTRRLHPQAAAEAADPTRAELARTLEQLAGDLDQARQRHVNTVVYFVYAGHGSVRDQLGYISLEDGHLGAVDLERQVVDKLKADQTHFIVDACYSSFLAAGRGPGGSRREVHGFSQVGGLAARAGVGLLFSTSSARESHEWAGVQAGVFSHEVRSGLFGAADANGDGLVTYREMVAFIQRANASVPNERYRPDVFAHPANESGSFVDLREGLHRRIEVKGAEHAHYLLEDTRGVRLADFHNAADQDLRVLRPAGAGQLYLRRVRDEQEFAIPASPEVVALAELSPSPAATQPRGAANDAYNALFALPFRPEDVAQLRMRSLAELDISAPRDVSASSRSPWRTQLGFSLLGVGVAGGVLGTLALSSAQQVKTGIGASTSQADAASANERIATRNLQASVAFAAAGAASLAGLALLLWPESNAPLRADVSAVGATLHLRGEF